MAQEVTVNASLAYLDVNGTADSLDITDALFNVATKQIAHTTQLITFSAEVAINLSGIAAPAFVFFKNLDPTNFIKLRVATSGAFFAKLRADTAGTGKGGIALLELGSGAQVPYAQADTADCRMEILLISL